MLKHIEKIVISTPSFILLEGESSNIINDPERDHIICPMCFTKYSSIWPKYFLTLKLSMHLCHRAAKLTKCSANVSVFDAREKKSFQSFLTGGVKINLELLSFLKNLHCKFKIICLAINWVFS